MLVCRLNVECLRSVRLPSGDQTPSRTFTTPVTDAVAQTVVTVKQDWSCNNKNIKHGSCGLCRRQKKLPDSVCECFSFSVEQSACEGWWCHWRLGVIMTGLLLTSVLMLLSSSFFLTLLVDCIIVVIFHAQYSVLPRHGQMIESVFCATCCMYTGRLLCQHLFSFHWRTELLESELVADLLQCPLENNNPNVPVWIQQGE